MFDSLFEAIEEWMRNLLKDMIHSNLSTMFTDVNQKTVYADLDLSESYDFEVMVDGVENVIGTFSATKKGTGKLSAVDAEEIIGNGSDIYVYLNDDAMMVQTTWKMVVNTGPNTFTR